MSVKMALLSLLTAEPRYGYQLRADFEERTGGAWPLNIGQVYTTLARMVRDGLVTVEGSADGDDTRTYATTDEGRAAVAGWFVTPVPRGETQPREELAIKIAVAVSSADVNVRDVIQRQRAETVRALQGLTRSKLSLAADDLTASLLVESQIFAVEAEARWLDLAESLVTRRRAGPPQPPSRVPVEPVEDSPYPADQLDQLDPPAQPDPPEDAQGDRRQPRPRSIRRLTRSRS